MFIIGDLLLILKKKFRVSIENMSVFALILKPIYVYLMELVKACVARSIVIGGRGIYGLGFIFVEFHRDTDKVLEAYIKLRQLNS